MRHLMGTIGTLFIIILFVLLIGVLQLATGGLRQLGAVPALIVVGGSLALLIYAVKKTWTLTAVDQYGRVNKKPVALLALLVVAAFATLLIADAKTKKPLREPMATLPPTHYTQQTPKAPEPQRPMSSVAITKEEMRALETQLYVSEEELRKFRKETGQE